MHFQDKPCSTQLLPPQKFQWMTRKLTRFKDIHETRTQTKTDKTQRKRILPIVDILPAKPQYLSFITNVIIKLYPIFRDHKLVRTYHLI